MNRLPFILISLLCLCAMPLRAQTSFPMVWSVFPAGVQRGTTTYVTVYAGGSEGGGGVNLYKAYRVLFQDEGIHAEIVDPDGGWPDKDPAKPDEIPVVDEMIMKVTTSREVRPGIYEFRIGTPYHGISTAGQLVIGDEPERIEIEPNTLEEAQTVTLPCVINGRLQEDEDADFYKFKVDKGQEFVFTVLCARLEDTIHDLNVHADPRIILRDQKGKELARNDDYFGADPLIHYKFDNTGEYLLEIRDAIHRGNPHWVYRLNITSRPFVTSVFPCTVRPGETATVQVSGFNLGRTETISLTVPSNVPAGVWNTPLTFPHGLSDPVPFLVTDMASIIVDHSSQTTGPGGTVGRPATHTLTFPCSINSSLTVKGQRHIYTFHAKENQALGFEVMARRLNSKLDSELKVRDASGNILLANDDAFGKDARIDWTAPAEGDYTIEVCDVLGRFGIDCFYNLTAAPLRPDFRLRCDTSRAMIAPGNRTTWYILVDRLNGFDGEVNVAVTGLPGGVTASQLTIASGINHGTVLLSAASDAKIDTTLVRITGTAMISVPIGEPVAVTRIAHPLSEIYLPGGGRGQKEVLTQGVSVTEPNDLEVVIDTEQITLTPGSTAKIGVNVKRRSNYTKPVTLDVFVQHLGDVQANPLPPGVTVDDSASKTLLSEGETTGYITLRAAPDAKPVNNVPIAVMANVSINFVMKVWYASPIISVTVKAPG